MPTGAIFPVLFDGNFIPAMTTLIRRSCYATVGPYDERLSYEDWDMWLRLARIYKFIFSPFISASYRLVSTSLVQRQLDCNNTSAQYSNFIIHSKCLESLKQDPPRYRVVVWRLAYYAENLYRLNHPRQREALDLVLKHAHVFRKLARPRLYLLRLCSKLQLPYWVFARLDPWMKRLG